MKGVKNFFIYFLATLILIGVGYAFGSLIFYLFDQSWGLIGIAIVFAVIIGLIGVIKED
jgi:hypothetical protein